MSGFSIEDFAARSGASTSSIERYAYQLHQMEKWVEMPLADASQRDLIELKKKLRAMASGKQYAALLRMFYKVAANAAPDRDTKERFRDLRDLLVLKQRVKRLSPQDILTVSEVQQLIDAAHSARDKALIALLWETGVRIHELLAVDLQHVQVRDSPENGGRKIYVVWFGKAKVRGEEHQGFVIETAPVLTAWLKSHPSPHGDSPLFVRWDGGRLADDGARAVLEKAVHRAGLTKRIHPHLFRHSRATHLLRLGVPQLQVQRLLGWKGPQMLQRYAHLADSDSYLAVLKAEGLAAPAEMDLGKLAFADQDLQPIVPLNAPPGVRPSPQLAFTPADVERFSDLVVAAVMKKLPREISAVPSAWDPKSGTVRDTIEAALRKAAPADP